MIVLDAATDIPFSTHPILFISVGIGVPLAGYLANFALKQLNIPDKELIKAAVQVLIVAIATAVSDTFVNGAKFWPDFYSVLLASFYAHNWLWKPSDMNVILGAAPTGNQTTKGLSASRYGPNLTAPQVAATRSGVPATHFGVAEPSIR